MRPFTTSRRAAAWLPVAVAAVMASATAGAAETAIVDPTTSIKSMNVAVQPAGLKVTGVASFGGEAPVVLMTDPAGDAQHGALDLRSGSISQPRPGDPALEMRVVFEDIPQVLPPEAGFSWTFYAGLYKYVVSGRATSIASSAVDTTAPQSTARTPAFQLRECDPHSKAPTCNHVRWLEGAVDTEADVISVKIPLGTVGTFPIAAGAELSPSDLFGVQIRASAQVGVDVDADTAMMTGPYRVPTRTVSLGVAKDGVAASAVRFTTPVNSTGSGAFSSLLDRPATGRWRVWVKACFVASCGVANRLVVIR